MSGYFQDDRHALYVGWIMGIGMRHGFDFKPVVDDDGNFTDRIIVNLKPYASITLVIPYPPEDWQVTDDDVKASHRVEITSLDVPPAGKMEWGVPH